MSQQKKSFVLFLVQKVRNHKMMKVGENLSHLGVSLAFDQRGRTSSIVDKAEKMRFPNDLSCNVSKDAA